MRKTAILAPVVALMLLGSAACGGDDDEGQVDNVSSDDANQDPGEDDGGETEGQTEAGGTVGDQSGGEVIGTVQADVSASKQAAAYDNRSVPVRLDITALRRNGDLVELQFVLTNEAEGSADDEDPLEFNLDTRFEDEGNSISGVGLVDQGDQKMYLPVLDSSGSCVCEPDTDGLRITPGESQSLSASFGGVPEDLDSVDVHVPDFPPITGVPIGG